MTNPDTSTPSLASEPRIISHDEAEQAARALIDHYFGNSTTNRVRTRVPVEDTDTDVVITTYIQQQRAASALSTPAPRPLEDDLKDAVMFIRMFITRKDMASLECLKTKALDWLKIRGYEGSIIRG